jgi:hypothetical protein
MPLSPKEIKALSKPYDQLDNADALVEHQAALDQLLPAEQVQLATTLIAACPSADLNTYGCHIEALRNHQVNSSFHSVMVDALNVRKIIIALHDPRNPTPYNQILTELDDARFNQFHTLATKCLAGQEIIIAAKLALTTPLEKRSQVAQIINNLFRESTFASAVGAAFTLRRDIDKWVNGHPEQFFSSPEFNPELWVQYDSVFQLVDDLNDLTAQQLAETIPESERQSLLDKIERLFNKNEFFMKTKTAFESLQKEEQKTEEERPSADLSTSSNRYMMYQSCSSKSSNTTDATPEQECSLP